MTRIVLSSISLLMLTASLCWGQGETVSPTIFSLDECLRLAVKNDADATLIAAKKTYNQAKSNVWTGWGRLLPKVDSNLGYSRRVVGPTEHIIYDEATGLPIVGVEGIQTLKGYGASVGARQYWSLGGYDYYSISEKKASKNSAKAWYQLARQELILSVKQAYFDVLKAKMLLEIQKEALKRANEQLKIAETRYELGAASYSDVLKAKVLYGDVELALISAENTLKIAKATLNSRMGQHVDSPIDVEENLAVPDFEYSYEDALKEMMTKNPKVKKAQFDLRSFEAQVGMYRSGLFPDFNLSGAYAWSNVDLDEIKDIRKKDYEWSLSASVSFNIFDNFQTKHRISYAKADRNSARETLRQTKNDVALQLKQAFLNVQEAKQKIDLTKNKVESAEEDLDLVQEKYNLGSASILELLDAEVSYKEAESDRVQALYDYNLAIAEFEKAMGK